MPGPAPIDAQLVRRILACPSLPTLPAVALQVLQACRRTEVDLSVIASVVARDPAISARLLRRANSASLATRRSVASLTHAVALLGTSATLAITLSFSLVGGRRRQPSATFDHPGFWRRALFSGLAGRALGPVVKQDLDEVFVACLLQDLGMLALNEVFPDDHGAVCQAAAGDHTELAAAEAAALGVDHAQVGALLARQWSLPSRLEEAIALSHYHPEPPAGSPGLRLSDAVYLSGPLADLWIATGPPGARRTALLDAAGRIGLPAGSVAAALRHMAASVPEAASDFDIDLGGPDQVEAILREAQLVLDDLSAHRVDRDVIEAVSPGGFP
jgi:HD-like signal output (HDOD) protein